MKIGIIGYGNLGHGVEAAVSSASDMELAGIFTRRDPVSITSSTGANVYHIDKIKDNDLNIDVMILCGGSATDLPEMTPEVAKLYNVVDSFDTHANIPTHFKNVDKASIQAGKVSVISVGWDPGLFSVARLYEMAALPSGVNYTFWGRGVSQGHSDAIRRIEGVLDARQYTVPKEEIVDKIKNGETPNLTTRDKHLRQCYVVPEDGADLKKIEDEIKSMPNYFSDYDVTVEFITKEEMEKNHSELPHGGVVIRNGKTGLNEEYNNKIEFNLNLDSNPYFTGSILVSFARAAYKMNKEGTAGCKTIFDIPPVYLLDDTRENIISNIL